MQACSSSSSRQSAVLFVLLFVLGSAISPAFAQTVREDMWIANDHVYSLATDGKTLYFSGQFTQVGPYTGTGVPVDLVTGQARAGFPQVDGIIEAVIPDGKGGWFIGGSFNSVGGRPRNKLAHVLADLTVSAWDPKIVSGLGVKTLLLSGTTLYVGGWFQGLGGLACKNLGAVDVSTGIARNWDPQANSTVRTLAFHDSTLYVGGAFTTIAGQTRNRAAAFDVTTGQLTAWQPNFDDDVYCFAMGADQIYVAGDFIWVNGAIRDHVVGIQLDTGLATAWDPNHSEGLVLALAVRGSTVYIGGYFSRLGNQPRNSIAAVDATTGALLDWNPGIVTHYGGQWV
jgi:trimeric autotransporter adhesin